MHTLPSGMSVMSLAIEHYVMRYFYLIKRVCVQTTRVPIEEFAMKRYIGDELVGKTVRIVNRREEYASQFNGEIGTIKAYRSVNRMYRYDVLFPSGTHLECRGYEVEVEEGEAA